MVFDNGGEVHYNPACLMTYKLFVVNTLGR